MYKRGESSLIRQEFWTVFGKYMMPVRSSEGLRVNWINYKTGIKDVYFRMETLNESASVSISIEHSDAGIRALFFEQFQELKLVFDDTLKEEWDWQQDVAVNGRMISRIIKELPNTSVFNKDQWPDLISFFKKRIRTLDKFWEDAKYSFETLK
ncbi:MAG TPA: DUF4268 domain-containing protein [Cyclobacteriaceae bacterium]